MSRPSVFALVLMAALLGGGCSIVGGSSDAPVLYAPTAVIQPDASWPQVDWGLAIAPTIAPDVIDSERIVVSPKPGELQIYRGARWAQTPAKMLEMAVLTTLEASGKITALARQGSGMAANYRLLMEVRQFRSDYAGGATPAAVIEVNAKLLDVDAHRIVADHDFRQQQPANGTAIAQVSEAFSQALGTIGHDIAGWALATGQTHQQGRR